MTKTMPSVSGAGVTLRGAVYSGDFAEWDARAANFLTPWEPAADHLTRSAFRGGSNGTQKISAAIWPMPS